MEFDYLDALRYAVDYETHCLGKWNIKEENNMSIDIPGKLRDDLKRIYGNIDPLNCIEDVSITESWDETLCHVTLRVPSSCLRYAKSPEIGRVPYSLEHWARQQAQMMCRCGIDFGVSPGAQKAPEKKVEAPEKKNTVDFPKPERILFSGPYTHVFWPDGSMTSVRLGEGEKYDEYTAFCAAVVKKMFGATHKAKKFLEKVKVIQKKKDKKRHVDNVSVEQVLSDPSDVDRVTKREDFFYDA